MQQALSDPHVLTQPTTPRLRTVDGPVPSRSISTASRILEKSRRLALLGIAGTSLCVVGLMLVGFYQIYEAVISAVDLGREGMSEMHFIVNVLEIMDTFLISSACFIITIGAYQLFIDSTISMPAWLTIKDFDDLKRRLAGVVVIILGLSFLADFVNWNGQTDIMREGVSAAAVIVALTLFMRAI
jgi:uncharacterized membrane protein YqhA